MARALGITSRIIVCLIETAVILAMLHVTKTTFETIVVSALVLIYTSVGGSFAFLGHALIEQGNQDLARFVAIGRSLRLDVEPYADALSENQTTFKRALPRFWISVTFRAVFAFLAIAALVLAVLADR